MKKSYAIKNRKVDAGITLVSLVVTIVILLILSGIAIATLGGENGLFARAKQAKKAHVQSEMQEQLTLALNSLQIDKNGSASLDDVTQDWINTVISNDYSPTIKEDASIDGKLVVMNKSDVTGKFLINQNLEISKTEYNVSTLEFEYKTVKIENGKLQILIKITDKINGINQVDYPDPSEKSLIMQSRKELVGIDYSVELGKEYKFVITTGDGNKTEKIIKIDDYYYNVTKTLAENAVIDNNATKAAYNKTYEATVSTEGNYAITGLTVTMGGKAVTTSGNNVVDINTGKIKIEKVTGDINITVTTKELKIQYSAVAVSKSSSLSNTISEKDNSIEKGTTLYINIIATLEGNRCTAVLKSNNSKTVPYAITSNGKYTFIVSGMYNEKLIEEEKEVIVNQYKVQGEYVKYEAGDWTEDEIKSLQEKNLYNINVAKKVNSTSGLANTFGGFSYEGDTENQNYINNKTIITNRNQSVSPESGYGRPIYSGWKILNSQVKNGKTYITKLIHAGSPENFAVYNYNSEKGSQIVSILRGRDWNMYIDKSQQSLIKEVHAMTADEAETINVSSSSRGGLRNIGSTYWLADPYYYSARYTYVKIVDGNAFNNSSIDYGGSIGANGGSHCWGIRLVVTMEANVYILSGTGTESDPYVLGKDE